MHGGRTKLCVRHQIQLGDGPPMQSVTGAVLSMCILCLQYSPSGKGDTPRAASTQVKCPGLEN